MYAAVALENDPWGRPLDEALSAKITGMIMDAYNPPYVESLLVEGIGPAMDEAFSVLMAAGVLQQQQFAPTVLSVPSSRDPNKRTPIASLSPDRPCWPELVVTAYEKDVTRVELCDAVIFGVAPEGVAELEKFLGYLESSRRAAVVRLDAATKARAGADGRRDRAGAGVAAVSCAAHVVCREKFAGLFQCQPRKELRRRAASLVFHLASVLQALAQHRSAKAAKKRAIRRG